MTLLADDLEGPGAARSIVLSPSSSLQGAAFAKTNAKKERFYRSLKGEHLDHLELLTRDQAEREIFAFIEIFYNRERIHTRLRQSLPARVRDSNPLSG